MRELLTHFTLPPEFTVCLPQLTRRQLLTQGMSGGVGIFLIAACAPVESRNIPTVLPKIVSTKAASPTPQLSPIPTERAKMVITPTTRPSRPSRPSRPETLAPEKIILQQAERWGIKYSQAETNRWKSGKGYEVWPVKPVMTGREINTTLGEIANTTLKLMRESENEYFNSIAKLHDGYAPQGIILFSPEINLPEGHLMLTIHNDNDKVYWEMKTNPLTVMRMTPFEFALTLASILSRVNQELEVQKTLPPNLPPLQQKERITAHTKIPQNELKLHAYAFGIEASALIFHAGLTGGYPGGDGIDAEGLALEFIRHGATIESPGWVEQIRQDRVPHIPAALPSNA